MGVTWIRKEGAPAVIGRRIAHTDIVLDIGPGIRPQNYFKPRVHICVEPYLPYIDHLRNDIGDDPSYVYLNATWDVVLKLLPDKSVDSVFMLDVIEHFEKEMGLNLLKQAERVARRQVIVFTPLGYYPQDYDDATKLDRWGMQGGYWQAHRSGWLPEDFGHDWDLVCCEAFHFIDQHDQRLDNPFGVIWAFRDLDCALGEKNDRRTYQKGTGFISKSVRFFEHQLRRLKTRL